MTAVVTQKHVKTVRRRKRRARDTNVTRSIQVVQTHDTLVRCKCTEKFAPWTKPDGIDEHNSKINFSSLSGELVSFFLWRNSNALSTSAVKFECKLF